MNFMHLFGSPSSQTLRCSFHTYRAWSTSQTYVPHRGPTLAHFHIDTCFPHIQALPDPLSTTDAELIYSKLVTYDIFISDDVVVQARKQQAPFLSMGIE